jgi:hypothetical protein
MPKIDNSIMRMRILLITASAFAFSPLQVTLSIFHTIRESDTNPTQS